VQNCAVLGDVKSTNSNSNSVGGVVGNNPGTVQNCYSTGNVTGVYNQVGGVVGRSDGMVQNCYSTGNVTGVTWVGGVVGNSNGTVQNCYALGNVEGNSVVGGVVGRSYGTVQNCAALNANVTATGGTNAGRVVGQNVLSAPLADNYAIDMGTTTTDVGTGGIDGATITTEQAVTQDAYLLASGGADFAFGTDDASPWVWGAFGSSYPLLTLYWQTASPGSIYSIDANGVLTGSRLASGAVVIPNVINGVVVTQIGDNCFKNNTNITSVTIPSTVTEIGISAFDGCTSLAAVTFDADSQLAVISTYAFYDCTLLTDFTFPAAVTDVESQSFAGSGLQEVTFLGNRPTISSGDYAEAFRNCSSLNSIYFTAVNTTGWPGVDIEAQNSFDPRPITPEIQP